MDIHETNLARLREFELDVIRAIVFAANSIVAMAESLDVALCRAEKERATAEDRVARGQPADMKVLDEIALGCRMADRAAESMSIGHLIGHVFCCAKHLAQFAEAIELERDPDAARCPTVSHPAYLEAALKHLGDRV
jgi:hypothetical protein